MKCIAIGFCLWSICSSALANQRPAHYTNAINAEHVAEARQICMADFHRLCPGQQPRNNAMSRCLGAYEGQVSSACAAVVEHWCAEGLCR